MKLTRTSREEGGILLMTLFTCVGIGIVLASFLALISARNKMTIRSTGWNACIPVLEAGIEEALTHIQKDGSATANGWTAATVGGQPVHTKKRTLPDGSYYNVTIYNAVSNNPIVYSQGFVPSPLEKGKYISRLVRIGATNPPTMWLKGVVVTGKITLKGNGAVDGFDSTLGLYNVLSNRLANGGVATTDGSISAITVGSGYVFGTAVTGPGGTVTVGNGAVGDIAWNTNNKGIQKGSTNNNMNASFPTNSPPSGSFLPPVTTSVGGSNIMFLATGTNKVTGGLSISSSKNPIIVTGNATLWVTDDFSISGNGYVQILPGASLTLIFGKSAKIGGGGIINQNGLSSKLTVIGLSSFTSFDFNGGADFYGTVNAPQADISTGGGSGLYGAVLGKSFTANGNGSLHYDKALAVPSVFTVTSWKEL